MKTNMILASCLVLGSSSAAMADSSFSLQARSSFTAGYRINARAVVRDHRIAPSQSIRFAAYTIPRDARDVRPGTRYIGPALPAVTGPTWDCHNWDPSVELSSVCTAYASSRPGAVSPTVGGGILLGIRDAAIPDHQYITVGSGQAFRKLVVQGNDCAPEITKVAVRFMDGSVQVVNADLRLREGRSLSFNLAGGYRQINQIVLYTPSGAHGSYAVLGR